MVVEDASERAQGVSVGLFLPRGFGWAVGLTPEFPDLVCNAFTGSAMLAQAIARHGTPQTVDLGQERIAQASELEAGCVHGGRRGADLARPVHVVDHVALDATRPVMIQCCLQYNRNVALLDGGDDHPGHSQVK